MRHASLLDIEKQSLKILSFRMINVHGMVGRLVQTIQDPDTAASLCGGREHCQRKRLFVNHLRAAEGKHQATGSHLGDGGGVQSLVGPQGIVQRSSMLGESRRIHNDEIVLVLRDIVEELYRVRAVASV